MAVEIVILARGGSIHHAKQILDYFSERAVVESDWCPSRVLRHAPSLVIALDEHAAELGLCIAEAARQNIATLQIMDGILEWRRTWHYPTSKEKRPLNQPALAHKIACLGQIDARIMESWGNVGKCEVIGSPRFDELVSKRKEIRREAIQGRPMRLLVMTAKTPGFSPEQVEITLHSLLDLKEHLTGRQGIEVIWRVTQNLHGRLGVVNTVRNVLSDELHNLLDSVDAVITTPSTAMLESMLAGHPVALLDYHNCPHYFPAAWRITCEEHIDSVLDDLRDAPLNRMLYQEFCLHDALACRGLAKDRMINLIVEMLRVRRECLESGQPLVFPHRIIGDLAGHISWPSVAFDLERLYPHHNVFGRRNTTEMQAELEAALGTIDILKRQVDILSGRINMIPGYKLAKNIHHALRNLRYRFLGGEK